MPGRLLVNFYIDLLEHSCLEKLHGVVGAGGRAQKADGRCFLRGIWSGALLVHTNLQMRLSRPN
jgi:hypothetical protein